MKKEEILVTLLILLCGVSCSNSTNHSSISDSTSLLLNASDILEAIKTAQKTSAIKDLEKDLESKVTQKLSQNNPDIKPTQTLINLTLAQLAKDNDNTKDEDKQIQRSNEEKHQSNKSSLSSQIKPAQPNQPKQPIIIKSNFSENNEVESKILLKETENTEKQVIAINITEQINENKAQANKSQQGQLLLSNQSLEEPSSNEQALPADQKIQTKTQAIDQQNSPKEQFNENTPAPENHQLTKDQTPIQDNFKLEDIKANDQDLIGKLQPVLSNQTMQKEPGNDQISQQDNQTQTIVQSLPLKDQENLNSKLITNTLNISDKSQPSQQDQNRNTVDQQASKTNLLPLHFLPQQMIHSAVNFTYVKDPPEIPILPFQLNLPKIKTGPSVFKELFAPYEQKTPQVDVSKSQTPLPQPMVQKKNQSSVINLLNNNTKKQKPLQAKVQEKSIQNSKDNKNQSKVETKTNQPQVNHKDQTKTTQKPTEQQSLVKKQNVQVVKKRTSQKIKEQKQLKPENKAVEKQKKQPQTKHKQKQLKIKPLQSLNTTKGKNLPKMIEQQDQPNQKQASEQRKTKSIDNQSSSFSKLKRQKQRQSINRATKINSQKKWKFQKTKLDKQRSNNKQQLTQRQKRFIQKNRLREKQNLKPKLDILDKKTPVGDQKIKQQKKIDPFPPKISQPDKPTEPKSKEKIEQTIQNEENVEIASLKQLKKANDQFQTISQIVIYVLLAVLCVVIFICYKSSGENLQKSGSLSRLNESGELQEDSQIEVAERLYQDA